MGEFFPFFVALRTERRKREEREKKRREEEEERRREKKSNRSRALQALGVRSARGRGATNLTWVLFLFKEREEREEERRKKTQTPCRTSGLPASLLLHM